MIGPASMPKVIVDRLNLVIGQSLQHPDIKSRLEPQGIESTTSTPQAFAMFIQSETRKWAKVTLEAGIKPD